MRCFRILLIASTTVGIAAADTPRFGDQDPAKLVPLEAAAFLQVRVKKFLDTPVGKQIVEKQPKEIAKLEEVPKRFGLKLADVDSFTLVWTKMAANGASDGPVFVLVTRQPFERKVVPANRAVEVLAPDLFVGGDQQKQIAAYIELYKKKSKHGPLEPANRQVSVQHVMFAGIAGQPRIPWLFPHPFENLKPIGEATSFGVVVSAKDGIVLRMIAEYPPGLSSEARDAAGQLPGFAPVFARNAPTGVPFWPVLVNLMANSQAQVDGPTLRIVSALPPEAIAAMLTPRSPRIDPKIQPKEKEDLKKIAAALLAYHDDNKQRFPAHAIYSANGTPLLSWRVALLPKLGQQELYDKFHRDEPWDSAHNKKLIAEMPELYFISRAAQPRDQGLTHYQLFVGPDATWSKSEETPGLKTIVDGTSNTIMLAQAAMPVIWSKPDDLSIETGKPLPKLGLGGHAVLIATFDASVRELSVAWPEKNWRAAITPAGGETIDWTKLEPAASEKVDKDQNKKSD